MDFGQTEELTDRLNNILSSYPNVSDVFKELLQNADDAGSDEIHFVYDPRSHKTEKIISKSWTPVQNLPALCVYNNRPFTDADIKGIQKVGIGGKRDDMATTGQFGIGFNAVYHLTDCPSFLSNKDTLCVFDPLLKYTQRAGKTCPGRRYETGDQFRITFPDMLSGYLEDIDEFKGFGGTIFRFPTENKTIYNSKECFGPQRVDELLGDFRKVAEECLLFLNNIKKITISCIAEQTNKLETKYCINASLSDEDQGHRTHLSEHLKLFKSNRSDPIPPMCHVYSLIIQDSTRSKETWLISQRLGFEDELFDGQGLKKRLPRGGVAALISGNRKWKVHDQQYKAYCVLPLPIHTHLPVHVNGMFELNQSRRDLSKRDDYALRGSSGEDDSLIHEWNKQLITNVIAPAYAKLLKVAGRKILQKNKDNLFFKDRLSLYDDLFPKDLEKVHGEWHVLAKATFCYVSKNYLEVLPVVRHKRKGKEVTWHHANSDTSLAFFDDLDDLDRKDRDAVATKETAPRTSTIQRQFFAESWLQSDSKLSRTVYGIPSL